LKFSEIKKICLLNVIVPLKTVTDYEIKFLWNIFFRYQYNLGPLKFSKIESAFLNREIKFDGYKVPYFVKVANTYFEKDYLKNSYIKDHSKYPNLEFYLIGYILFVHKEHFKHIKSYPPYFSKLLTSQHCKAYGNVSISKAFFQIYKADSALKHLNKDCREDLLKILFNIYFYYAQNLPIYSNLNSKIHQEAFNFLDKVIIKISIKDFNFEISNLILAWYLIYKDNNLKIKNITEDHACYIFNSFTKEAIFDNLTRKGRPLNAKNYFRYLYKEKKLLLLSVNKNRRQEKKIVLNKKTYSGGVNIVGWPNLQIGIGEDSRAACHAVSFAKINFSLKDVGEILPTQATKNYFSYHSKYLKSNKIYQTDLCFLDLASLYRYYFHLRSNSLHIPKKIIGVCPWELSSWPKHLDFVFDTIDIFFASSKFIFDTFNEYFSNKNIYLVRPVIDVPEHFINNFDIENLNEPFTFINIFDGLSSIDRKNPEACAKAFVNAFPRKNNDVRLILKMMHQDMSSPCLNSLLNIIKNDNRIQIINESVTKPELFRLINQSHCFVSLHRSEGLGRNIGESMLFGRPTIVSNYSGNKDFCNDNTSFIVDGKLIKVGNKYSNSQSSSVWFEPNIESAVEAFKSVFYDRTNARIIAQNGKEFIKKNYSINTVGNKYKELFLDLLN
jgi:hypothetical protein